MEVSLRNRARLLSNIRESVRRGSWKGKAKMGEETLSCEVSGGESHSAAAHTICPSMQGLHPGGPPPGEEMLLLDMSLQEQRAYSG